LEAMKDKVNIQDAEVEEMRLKCVAYEGMVKRLKEEIGQNQKDLSRLA